MDINFSEVWEAIPPFGIVQWFVVIFGSFFLILWTLIIGLVILQCCGRKAERLLNWTKSKWIWKTYHDVSKKWIKPQKPYKMWFLSLTYITKMDQRMPPKRSVKYNRTPSCLLGLILTLALVALLRSFLCQFYLKQVSKWPHNGIC